jgi:flavin-dependent dehydrogenase
MHDVVICGAGPAGAMAATMLARAGATVLLLDRARFPRDKLCGDTVNPGSVALLMRRGLGHVLEGALPVDGMIVTGPSGLRVEGRYDDGVQGRAITRRDLDARLVAAAAAAGAVVDDGVVVERAVAEAAAGGARVRGAVGKMPSGRSIALPARVVVAADGRHSRIARGLGLSGHPLSPRRWAIGAYFEGVAGLRTCGEMHIRSDRYIGVAPLPSGVANACVVTTRCAALRNPERLLLDSVRSDPELAGRFAGARLAAPAVCIGPLAVEARLPGTEGLLMAGDAAGFVDPMTGDGLRFALRGAELAAEAILDVLAHGWRDAHRRLGEARQREFAPKLRFNRTLRAVVGSPATLRLADRGAWLAPAVIRTLIRYAGDYRGA